MHRDVEPAVVLAEALAQRNGIIGYFRGIVTFNAASYPATHALCAVALHIAHFCVMYYKARFRRPRPSELLPHRLPPIEVPGHAACPSGHATQAWLIAHTLKSVIRTQSDPPAQPGWADLAFDAMAERIARNREVLGLHYPSDTAAGRTLAERIWPTLKACPSIHAPDGTEGGLFDGAGGLLAKAKAEWAI
ncbi:phosphatase PAP2 family protein [Elioraea sp.]|uniref:phosphatase PAP2 family protein n=1 Tax=Elioraea sp. TaxID=2185103 RepID=UPI003F6EC552